MAPQADATSPSPFQRLVDGEGQPKPGGLEDAEQQVQEPPGESQGRPRRSIEDLMILAEVGLVVEAGLPQGGGDGPSAPGEDGPEDQGDDLGPGRSGELAAEGLQDR
jgi:hypothetical protein